MAESTISGTVVSRFTRSFTGDKGDDITYHEARINDALTGDLYVFRSSKKIDLEDLIPGQAVQDLPVRVDKRCTVQATLVRPLTDDKEGNSAW